MIDLPGKLQSPILLHGDDVTAYRDPAVLYHDGVFHLFYSLIEVEDDGSVFSYTALSTSRDLLAWTPPRKLTPRDQALNYSSPGNVIRFGDEWFLCLQTYPRPGYKLKDAPRFGDENSRVFLMRSPNLVDWSEPQVMHVKGPDIPVEQAGRMIDPYLLEDKDQSGLWWCFYKQNGVSMSCSRDLKTWAYAGHVPSGENVCVLVENNEYMLFHSPHNGIGMKRSPDLVHWRDCGQLITLGQKDWPWASGRITAAAVTDLRHVAGIGKYLMFFHGSGPQDESKTFDNNASIGIAWSDDLGEWSWPGRR